MENITVVRDYTRDKDSAKNDEDLQLGLRILQSGAINSYCDVMKKAPTRINEEEKITYEYLLSRCDWFARIEHGKLEAMVDYNKIEAWINVYLPFFEFETPDRLEFLYEVAQKADTVSFTIKDNYVRLHIQIAYFECDIDESLYIEAWYELISCIEKEDLNRLCELDKKDID